MLQSFSHFNLTINHFNWVNLMTSIIIKKLDHYQSTRLTLQFICTRCRLRTFYLAIKESSNWTILSKTDYNFFVDHTTLFRRAAELFTACINRAALTTNRSNTQHHFWLTIYDVYRKSLWVYFEETSDRKIE